MLIGGSKPEEFALWDGDDRRRPRLQLVNCSGRFRWFDGCFVFCFCFCSSEACFVYLLFPSEDMDVVMVHGHVEITASGVSCIGNLLHPRN